MLVFSLFACGSLIWVAYEMSVAVPVDELGLPNVDRSVQAASQHDGAGSAPIWAPAHAKV